MVAKIGLIVLLTCASSGIVACSRSESVTPAPIESAVARGEYLFKSVAMCTDCHTPRKPDGSFDQQHGLYGGTIDFAPTVAMPVWAEVAPAIAGLPGYTEAEAVALLERGETAGGRVPRLPVAQATGVK